MSEIKYVSLANLQSFSTQEHRYEKVVLKAKETPNTGMYASIDVFQGVDADGKTTKTAIGTIDIPLDKYVTAGEIRTVAAEGDTPAKCYIDLTVANQTNKVSIDISSVSGDVADVKAAIEKLNNTVDTEGSVLYMIKNNAVNATYTESETIKDALDRLDKDLTFKGTTTAAITSPSEGDLYYFNIAATESTAAVVGWKFWSTKDAEAGEWKELSDATLATRVSELETQVGKDKDVTAYQEKTDLVDIINVLTGADTVDGSVAKAAASALADAKSYADTKVSDLDATVEQEASDTNPLALSVTETDGKITAISGSITANTFDAYGAASAVSGTWGEGKTAKTVSDVQGEIDTLNGAVTADGSVLKMINENAKDAKSGSTKITGYQLKEEPHTAITVAEYNALSDEQKALYEAVTASMTIEEAIADAKSSAEGASVVTVEKLGTATEGFASSYVVKQNGEQVGATIDIPKDYLVKGAKLVHYVASETEGKYYEIVSDPEKKTLVDLPTYISADQVGKDLIDFTVNTSEGSGTESHIIIDVTHLVDVYTGKTVDNGISVSVSDDYEISATVSGKAIARTNVTDEFEADIAALEGTHAKDSDNKLISVASEIKTNAESADFTPETGDKTTIQAAIRALQASSTDTNGAFVYKGSVAKVADLPTTASKGDAYKVTATNSLYICTSSYVPAEGETAAVDAVYAELAVDGTFSVGNDTLAHAVSVKDYIDSRIFIGTQTEADNAKAAGTIDDTTLCIITDEDSQTLTALTDEEISALFD